MSNCSEKMKSTRGITQAMERLLLNGAAPHQLNYLTIAFGSGAATVCCRTNEHGSPEWSVKVDANDIRHCHDVKHAFVTAIHHLETYR